MSEKRQQEKGIVLLIVLAAVLITIILANVILNIISSQSRLTRHQVSRIQAYYASMAGVNYAYEQIRRGTWVPGTNCLAATPCQLPTDTNFPAAIIQPVTIVIRQVNTAGCMNPPGNSACISVTTNYAYTP